MPYAQDVDEDYDNGGNGNETNPPDIVGYSMLLQAHILIEQLLISCSLLVGARHVCQLL